MSGRKNILTAHTVVTAGDMSGDITSSTTQIPYLDNVGVQFSWTGTPTGNFFVDVSLDGTTWNPITLSPAPSAAGSAGSYYIDINQSSALYMRCRYVATSGSGTLTAKIAAKMV